MPKQEALKYFGESLQPLVISTEWRRHNLTKPQCVPAKGLSSVEYSLELVLSSCVLLPRTANYYCKGTLRYSDYRLRTTVGRVFSESGALGRVRGWWRENTKLSCRTTDYVLRSKQQCSPLQAKLSWGNPKWILRLLASQEHPNSIISKARRVCKSLKSAPFPPAQRDGFRGSSKFRQNISSNRISRPKANPKCVLAKVLRQYIKWQQWMCSLDRIKRNIYGFHHFPFDINFHSKSRLPNSSKLFGLKRCSKRKSYHCKYLLVKKWNEISYNSLHFDRIIWFFVCLSFSPLPPLLTTQTCSLVPVPSTSRP